MQKFLSPIWQGTGVGSSSPSPLSPQHRLNSTATDATFETRPYKLHKLDDGPSGSVECSRDQALTYYRQMQVIRRIEAAAGNLYKEKVSQRQILQGKGEAEAYSTIRGEAEADY